MRDNGFNPETLVSTRTHSHTSRKKQSSVMDLLTKLQTVARLTRIRAILIPCKLRSIYKERTPPQPFLPSDVQGKRPYGMTASKGNLDSHQASLESLHALLDSGENYNLRSVINIRRMMCSYLLLESVSVIRRSPVPLLINGQWLQTDLVGCRHFSSKDRSS